MASKALEARHLSGPVAASVLAEALAGVALLSADAASEEEAWMLRLHVAGPVEGLLVEGTGAGALRGFTNRKTLDDLDGVLPIETAPALGSAGSVQIVSTLPGRILNQAVLQVNPPLLRYVLARYFQQSQQVPTGCRICVQADDGGLLTARATLVQRREDSDQDVFIRMLEHLEQGAPDDFMRQRVWPQDVTEPLAHVLGCDAIHVRAERPLAFGCRCNKAKVVGVLAALSLEELEALIASGSHQDVTCHMCGQTYTADTADLRTVREKLQQRASTS